MNSGPIVIGKLANYHIISLLHSEFVSNSFYSSDTIDTELLTNFSNMYIDSTVAYNYVVAPNLV